MDIDPIIISVDDHLAEVGDTWPLAGHLDVAGYELGNHSFQLPEGVDYDVVLTNTGDGILATGIVKASVVGECDRCLDPASFSIASEVEEYFLFELPAADEQNDDEDDVDFALVSPDRTIDLADAVNAAVVMETPFVVLCAEDCRGLCPQCGANLNHGDCGCQARRDAEPDPMNPFSVLAALRADVAEGELERAAQQDEADEAAAEAYARAEDAKEDGQA